MTPPENLDQPVGIVGLRVFLFAATLFLLELLFFRILGYVTHYLESTLIIAYALAGVAVGGLVAARTRFPEPVLYFLCLLGTQLCLTLSVFKVLRYPSLGPDNLALVGMFAFPALYISQAFRRHSSGSIYLLDLGGAGSAVVLFYLAHRVSYLEEILLVISLGLALLCLPAALRLPRSQGLWATLSCLLIALSGGGLHYENTTGQLNMFYLARHSELSRWKDFSTGHYLERFYDNPISRVEVYRDSKLDTRYYYVTNGMIMDGFRPDHPMRFHRDPRVIGGFFDEPEVFIIGSSAEGILKTVRTMTRPEKIHGSEVNPAVLEMMKRDYVKETGYMYAGLDQKLGNALALLNSDQARYDIITLMNPHSGGQMFLPGPPNWLHTVESYELYLDSLSEEGYIMVEERPMVKPGHRILQKRIATIYEALKRHGADDPSQHLFIYSWHWNRHSPYKDFTEKVFTSIFVKKKALTSADKQRLMDWIRATGTRWTEQGKTWVEASPEERATSAVRFDYLPGIVERDVFQELFRNLETGDLKEAYPGWDLEPATDDRPFTAQVDRTRPELMRLMRSTSWLLGLLLLPALFSFRRAKDRLFHAQMHCYQLLAGTAYILVEVFLMQLYQKYILSATMAFVLVLSVLLAASGWGGRKLFRSRHPALICLAVLLSLGLHLALSGVLASWEPLSHVLVVGLVTAATAFSGYFMGAFLPMGLQLAKTRRHTEFTEDYFASNSLGGTLALVLSLYLSVVYGFTVTAAVAAGCYLLVALAAGLMGAGKS